ncbi:MAG TPA: ATP-binding protein [Isosphaeraceae bacterium]
MRVPALGMDWLEDLRRRIERLGGLPLRATTVRRIVADGPEARDPADLLAVEGARFDEVDPGWALARSGAGAVDPEALAAERTWWPALAGPEAAAVDRLWRHGVAASCAARRLAEEAGEADPGALARAGLLLNLGAWALAAVDPRRWAQWLALADPEARRDAGRAWLGADLNSLGRDLARRWGCAAVVVDAAWLHEDADGDLSACAAEPGRLALIRKAYTWAERTPWALGVPGTPGPGPPDPRLRWLLAEVRARCAGGLAAADATGHEERLARGLARLRRDHTRLLREREQSDRFLAEVAEAGAPAPETRDGSTGSGDRPGLRIDPGRLPAERAPALLGRARRAWAAETAERACADGLLAEATAALRRRVEHQERTLRLGRLEALAEFAAGAGHELNNPLAVILGRAQLLLGRTGDPDAARSLRAIIAQAQRAHRILRDLMYVARPPAPRPRPCQPGEILRACLADLEGEAAARGVRLLGRSRRPGPRSWADPEALRHLAEVLVRNALEATPAGGTVRVVAGGDDRRIVWTVRDDGRGIAEGEGARLFDPFFCGRQAGRGLGLGLPRALRFVALAGGDLRWRSAPGRGTVFRLTLPVTAPPEPPGLDAGPGPGGALPES